jgi:hypothetical protein
VPGKKTAASVAKKRNTMPAGPAERKVCVLPRLPLPPHPHPAF